MALLYPCSHSGVGECKAVCLTYMYYLLFRNLLFLYKVHGITRSGLKACREKYDKKLDPKKRDEEVQL